MGELQWDRWHQAERFELYSLLMEPAQVWRPEIAAFAGGGDPRSICSPQRRGARQAAFPFAGEGYVIHPGRGSHFGEVPGADQRYQILLQEFRRETGVLTGASPAAACKCWPDPL